jgi:hypothetical protein
MSDVQSEPEVTVYIEREADNKYKLNSAHLALIGDQLRGKPKFSIFNSILLPLIISIATVVFSSAFQYVSWLNTARLQNATETASRASTTYENAASAIGKRRYASFLFVPSTRDLVNLKKPVDSEVYKTQAALNKRRFDAYYEQLRFWNEGYDKLVTDIDYGLDRPIFLMMGLPSEGNAITIKKIEKIDCTKALSEQLRLNDLNGDSLKAQFAGIARCFYKAISPLSDMKDRAVLDATASIDPGTAERASANLDDITSLANQFRRYALRRIEYFNHQKEVVIVSPATVVRWLTNEQQRSAKDHLVKTKQRCDLE